MKYLYCLYELSLRRRLARQSGKRLFLAAGCQCLRMVQRHAGKCIGDTGMLFKIFWNSSGSPDIGVQLLKDLNFYTFRTNLGTRHQHLFNVKTAYKAIHMISTLT